MDRKPKGQEYRVAVTVFPENNKPFDTAICATMKRLILEYAGTLKKPTLLAISDALGIDRNRLSRLIMMLGIEDQYGNIKARANLKRAEERKLKRAEASRKDCTTTQKATL